jgi:hypothetical protein
MKNLVKVLLVVLSLVVLSLSIVGPDISVIADNDSSNLYAGKVPVPLPQPRK